MELWKFKDTLPNKISFKDKPIEMIFINLKATSHTFDRKTNEKVS